jgi:hypothetical protein
MGPDGGLDSRSRLVTSSHRSSFSSPHPHRQLTGSSSSCNVWFLDSASSHSTFAQSGRTELPPLPRKMLSRSLNPARPVWVEQKVFMHLSDLLNIVPMKRSRNNTLSRRSSLCIIIIAPNDRCSPNKRNIKTKLRKQRFLESVVSGRQRARSASSLLLCI